MHFYGWKKGLKTGMYYLRTRPKADAIQFTVDQQQLSKTVNTEGAKAAAGPIKVIGAATAASAVSESGVTDNRATVGLEYAAEIACESCSA